MRKWPLGAAALAAAGLGLPWVLGAQAERFYADALARLPEQGLRVVDSRYERGWFGSRASTGLAVMTDLAEVPDGPSERMRVSSEIGHGPLRLDAPRLLSAAVIRSRVELADVDTEAPPLLLETVLDLDGGGEIQLRLPAIGPAASEQPGLETVEGTGSVRFGSGFSSFEGRFELPSLSLSDQEGSLRLRGLSGESSASRLVGSVFAGTASLRLDELALRLPDAVLDAGGISVKVDSEPQGRLLNARAAYRVERLTLQGADYGPSLAEFSLSRVSGDDLAALQQALRQVSAQPLARSLAGLAMAAVLAEHLPRLLATDPAVGLDRLEVTTPEGRVEGRLLLSARGLSADVMRRPGAWLAQVVGEGDVSLPESLLLRLLEERHRSQALETNRRGGSGSQALTEEAEREVGRSARDQLAALVRDGWLVAREGRVSTEVKLADALLTINGKTLPIAFNGLPEGASP